MTHTSWEHWHWKVQKRNEYFLMNKRIRVPTSNVDNFHEVGPCLLHNLGDDKQAECYLGWDSCGIVTPKKFRGIDVAVKQLHIRSTLNTKPK